MENKEEYEKTLIEDEELETVVGGYDDVEVLHKAVIWFGPRAKQWYIRGGVPNIIKQAEKLYPEGSSTLATLRKFLGV